MIWAMYAASAALRSNGLVDLADRYTAYLDYLATTAQMIFYRGNGLVAWVATINNTQAMPTPDNYGGAGTPGDPYEVRIFDNCFDDLRANSTYPMCAGRTLHVVPGPQDPVAA